MSTFCSLPDLVLLEILSHLSCEDCLLVFANWNINRLTNLLVERGAFQQIRFSSALCYERCKLLVKHIWRFDSVLSLVAEDVFADAISYYTSARWFPSLVELRLLRVRHILPTTIQFVIAHASTLTHLTVTPAEQPYQVKEHSAFFDIILPHLSNLTVLNTGWKSDVQIDWAILPNGLQSLKHLTAFAETMSDIYILLVSGILPRLQSLYVRLDFRSETIVSESLPDVDSLHLPELESFYFRLFRNDKVKWSTIEQLTSLAVMPRLRHCTLEYDLEKSIDIRQIFASPLFDNDERHVRVRFLLIITDRIGSFSSSDDTLSTIRSGRYNEIYREYLGDTRYIGCRMWYTRSWPRHASWILDNMHDKERDQLHIPLGRQSICVVARSISLHWFTEQVSSARSLRITGSTSFSLINSSSPPMPLIHVKELLIDDVISRLEYLLDGIILPRLRYIHSPILPLFIALICRINQRRSVDTIDRLVLSDDEVNTFAIKHWQIVLDFVPHLQSLIIFSHADKCPPTELAHIFIDYLHRASELRLVLFSFCFITNVDWTNKTQFIEYLKNNIKNLFQKVKVMELDPIAIDVWLY